MTERGTDSLSDSRNGINHDTVPERRMYCLNFGTAAEQCACCTYVTCVAQENRVIAVTYETISNAGMPNRNIVPFFLYAVFRARTPAKNAVQLYFNIAHSPVHVSSYTHRRVRMFLIKMRHSLYLHSYHYPRS